MYLGYILLIAVVNSIDNMAIRAAYSIGGIKVQAKKNLLISFMAFVVSFTASMSGGIISNFFSDEVCSILSMGLLVFMGLKLMLEPYSKKKDEKVLGVRQIGYREAVSVGIALALDDIGGAVSVGLMGYSPLLVGAAFFIVSYIIFLSGNYLVRLFSRLKVGNWATFIAGIIMILIGISQVIE